MADALVFLLTLRTWQFSGWNSICQRFSKSASLSRSCCRHSVCLVVNGEACNSIICREAHGGPGQGLSYKEETGTVGALSLGNSWFDRHGPAPLPIDDHHQGTVRQEAFGPFQGAASYPITGNFPQQAHLTDFVKSITEVHSQYVSLVASVAVTRQVMQELYKLCFTWEHASEPVL